MATTRVIIVVATRIITAVATRVIIVATRVVIVVATRTCQIPVKGVHGVVLLVDIPLGFLLLY